MRYIFIGFVALSFSTMNAQSLARIEYFIDNDLGYGQGTAIQLPTDTSGAVNFTVDLSNVSDGVHRLYVRALDDGGRWSVLNVRPFLKLTTAGFESPSPIAKVEYAIDADSGAGKGISIPISSDSAHIVINLDTVSAGVHRLYLRAQDARGMWSAVNARSFVREGNFNPQRAPITSLGYFFTQNGVRTDTITRTVNLAQPSFDTTLSFSASLSGLLADSAYQLHVFARDARTLVSPNVTHAFTVTGNSSTKEQSEARPKTFALAQNYPNPFNPTTVIQYDLPFAAMVKVEVFDLLGRKVATLVSERQDAGRHQVEWNAARVSLSSGVYFYRMNAGAFVATKKMMLVK